VYRQGRSVEQGGAWLSAFGSQRSAPSPTPNHPNLTQLLLLIADS
jgi:hypothetical protein